jgi:hypothetical protein
MLRCSDAHNNTNSDDKTITHSFWHYDHQTPTSAVYSVSSSLFILLRVVLTLGHTISFAKQSATSYLGAKEKFAPQHPRHLSVTVRTSSLQASISIQQRHPHRSPTEAFSLDAPSPPIPTTMLYGVSAICGPSTRSGCRCTPPQHCQTAGPPVRWPSQQRHAIRPVGGQTA